MVKLFLKIIIFLHTEPTSSKFFLSILKISEIRNGCLSDKLVIKVRQDLWHCSLVILITNPIY